MLLKPVLSVENNFGTQPQLYYCLLKNAVLTRSHGRFEVSYEKELKKVIHLEHIFRTFFAHFLAKVLNYFWTQCVKEDRLLH